MNAKEKAFELFNKMYNVDCNDDYHEMQYEHAKSCAIIAVDEILSLCWGGNEVGINYWKQVKTEIEKL